MTCTAAIIAVLEKLPPSKSANLYYRYPLPAKTDEEIFRSINWWTLQTIRESLLHLVAINQCIARRSSRGIVYRRK